MNLDHAEQLHRIKRMNKFKADVMRAANIHSIDTLTGIPDFMIAQHLVHSLEAGAILVAARDGWKGDGDG